MRNKLAKIVHAELSVAPATTAYPAKDEAHDMRERRYRAEEALRTLCRADEIRRDRLLMADIKIVAREQRKSLEGVAAKR